ncbi:DUF3048 domain-containing protein [Dethiobacter alkaliphilus]|uniref:DUF3048 domain-containing protein n=1 Tax=Dethiobacter alkaliphilus TaxID=427926 RepID=UPI0022261E5F|nr:DUF3048 domain-containing protein [Dethiobacter alkaliphilus]MCW3488795.1 DUF3048 domain-containing protein [Dethiobacter alkaliphilus]
MRRWLIVFLILLLSFTIMAGCGRNNDNNDNFEPTVPEPPPEEDTGIVTLQKVDPVTVVINNHAGARPQSGLQEASIVYEFLVEAGYTRLLAVYDTKVEENVTVGPVRSLRPYFAVQAMEHGGIAAHSGYSERTRSMIQGLGLREITSGTYLYRDNSRNAPHNLYTSTDQLYAARGDSEVRTVQVEAPDLPAGYEEGLELDIRYAGHNQVRYEYDAANEVYLRFVDGRESSDRETGKQYNARRVIVRENRVTNVPGESLVDIDLSGSGSGLLYEEGRKYNITWEKSGGETRYYYQNGTPVDLSFGNTWIQSVRQ